MSHSLVWQIFIDEAVLRQIAYFVQVLLNILIGQFIIHKIAGKIFIVRSHVNQSMTGEIEQNHFLFTCFLAFVCFADGGGNGMY